ncbi:MAG: AbrB/MazE/SpoVT family DNA-binding domain-containing protein [Nitrososphaeraceae archaeon]
MTKPKAKGNIRLKRVIAFTGTTSLGITLPRAFVRKLNLAPGTFVKCELHNDDKTIIVEGLDLG